MTTKKNKDKKDKKGDDDDDTKDDYEEEYDDEEEDEEEDKEDEEEDEEDEEDDDESEYDNCKNHKVPSGGYFNKFDDENKKQRAFLILKTIPKKNNKLIKKIKYNFYNKYNNNEKLYFDSLTTKGKNNVITLEEKLLLNKKLLTIPMRFKILELDINERTKQSIIFKLESINRMSSSSGEYHKINNWLNILNDIPFNKYFNIPIKNTDGNDKICLFLNSIRDRMNNKIYGHKEAKEQIIRVLAQLISFPKAYGYIIGLQGSAGIGKTKLIKEGICDALNYPNAFISLSGVDDSSFLKDTHILTKGQHMGRYANH